MDTTAFITGGVGFLIAIGLAFLYQRVSTNNAKNKSDMILKDAARDAENRIKEAELTIKEKNLTSKEKMENEFNKTRNDLREQERELDKQQNSLTQASQDLKKQESLVEQTQNRLTAKLESSIVREKELSDILERQRQQLHQITGLSVEDAEKRLLEITEDHLSREVGGRILKHEKMLEETCEQKSREMLLMTMQRFAATYTSETTTSTVDIPNDEMKGRIIGREGRNIRAFEKETGIDVIIDDTPGVVIVSGFDPVRRR